MYVVTCSYNICYYFNIVYYVFRKHSFMENILFETLENFFEFSNKRFFRFDA